jgi:DNA-binding HxlR family transcriptional regulator
MVSEQEIRELIIKKTRRTLLTTLKMFYPATADFESIALSLPTIEERYLKVDLSYLIDKGYVEWVNRTPNMGWRKREYRLTATGVETADRINKDPALEA